MRYIFCLSFHNRLIKSLVSLFVLLIFPCLHAGAQHRKDPWLTYGGGGNSSESGYGISLNADYDVPTAELGNTFKAAPALNLTVFRNYGDFTFTATLGYHTYSPKQATFAYDDGSGGTATVVYDNYEVFAAYSGVVYNLQLTDAIRVYAGFNYGIYFTHYAYNSQDQGGNSSINENDEDWLAAPKIGVTYMLTDQIGLGLEAKYNFFSPGSESDVAPNAVYKSYAGGLVLSYKF